MNGFKKEIREEQAGGRHHGLAMIAPKNLFWFRVGRFSGPTPE